MHTQKRFSPEHVCTLSRFGDILIDFESSVVMKFESTTKTKRETQNDHLEHTIFILSKRLQRFSKRAHEICHKTADFLGPRYQRAKPLEKIESWRIHVCQT